jgi:dihydrofolate reductase
MGKVRAGISMSLDGYVAGPNATLEVPLGEGGEDLHEWTVASHAWREQHGREGGDEGIDSEVVAESIENVGAQIMGRNMYSGGFGPGAWDDDPNPTGWWGDDPPFHVPVFVLTHHAREPLEMKGGTTFHFVTDGIEAALKQARAAAEDKDVFVAGGGRAIQQYIAAGLVDELEVHIATKVLGGGVLLFENLGANPPKFEVVRALSSPGVAHVKYRVA